MEIHTLSVSAPGVLRNDMDVFGNSLTAVLSNAPAHGTLTLTNNGGFTYTPSNGFSGTDTFIYQPRDGTNNLDLATVTITVLPITNVLTVTVNNTNRIYGATNPVFTVTYSGFVNGDTTNVLIGSPLITTAAATNSPVGGFAIAATNGTLNVQQTTISFSRTAR